MNSLRKIFTTAALAGTLFAGAIAASAPASACGRWAWAGGSVPVAAGGYGYGYARYGGYYPFRSVPYLYPPFGAYAAASYGYGNPWLW